MEIEKAHAKKLIEDEISERVAGIESQLDDLQLEEMKTLIASYIIDVTTILEIFLGLKLSGLADTLTEASILKDYLYKRGEMHNKQQSQNALHEIYTN